jgi:hypothetical protein
MIILNDTIKNEVGRLILDHRGHDLDFPEDADLYSIMGARVYNSRGHLYNSPYENVFSNITRGLSSWLEYDYMYMLTRSFKSLPNVEFFTKTKSNIENILTDIGLGDIDIPSFCNSLRYSRYPKIITLLGQEEECKDFVKDGFDVNGAISAFRQNISECFPSPVDAIRILTQSVTEKCFDNIRIEEECLRFKIGNISSITSFSTEENCVQNAISIFSSQCINNSNFAEHDTRFIQAYFGYPGIATMLAGLSDSICAETFSTLWDQWKEWNTAKAQSTTTELVTQLFNNATQSFNGTITAEEGVDSKRILPEEGYQFGIGEGILITIAGVAVLVGFGVIGAKCYSKVKDALVDCISYAGYEGLNGQGQSVEYHVDQAGGTGTEAT